MTVLVDAPYEFYVDTNRGGIALDAGYIYIGEENKDPVANPIVTYWDKDLQIKTAQPIRTISGYPSYNGSPGNIFVAESNFSITIKDKNLNLISTTLSRPGSAVAADVEDTSETPPPNRVISGASRTNSEAPDFLDFSGSGANVTILGGTTNLLLSINDTSVVVSSDILISGLTTAPTTGNTCLINDSTLTDQLASKYSGEDESTLKIDAAGAEITNRIGKVIALQKNGGTEIMLAYVKSATELTNVYRGYFFDSNSDPIVRETLANNDQLNILSLAWIFIENDGLTTDVTYTNPVYSYTQPSGTAGDYWFDMTNEVWKRYSVSWSQVNRTLIGMVAIGTANTEGKRETDFYYNYLDTNTIGLEIFSDEIIRSKDKINNVYAYSQTLRIDPTKVTWDNTKDMETGAVAANTAYYLYIASTGQRIVSLEKYYTRNDLRGQYHPYEAWRYIGEGTTDATSDWVSVIDKDTSDDTTDTRLDLIEESLHFGREPGLTQYGNGAVIKFDQWSDEEIFQGPIVKTSGILTVGVRYKIKTFVAGDDFANVGGTNVSGNEFVATGTTPTTWTNSSILESSVNLTSGSLEVGRKYKIKTYNSGDDFSNVGGTNATGTYFTATGTTPTIWANSSILHEVGFGFTVPYKKNNVGAFSNVFTGYKTIGWEGNGKNQTLSLPSTPGFHWIKNRDAADSHILGDLHQAEDWNWFSDGTGASTYDVTRFKNYLSQAVKLGDNANINTLAESFISWNWSYPLAKAWHANTDGATSKQILTPWGLLDSVQGNSNDGMSSGQYIIEVYNPLTGNGALLYTGSGTNRLLDISGGIAPEFMFAKSISAAGTCICYHSQQNGGTDPADYYLQLSATAAETDLAAMWNDTEPTGSLISLGTNTSHNNNGTLGILYYFTPITGLQNFGGYAGNAGSNDQATGCKDGMFFTKLRAGGTANWSVYDSFRGPDLALNWNLTAVESTAGNVDFNSTSGIDLSGTDADVNASGDDYVFGHFGDEMVIQEDINSYLIDALISTTGNDNVQIIFPYKGAATINTELILRATRESTPNWVTLTIEELSSWIDSDGETWKLLKASGDISDNSSGTAMRFNVVTDEGGSETEHNFKWFEFSWSASNG